MTPKVNLTFDDLKKIKKKNLKKKIKKKFKKK